jgi:hypothetical protein
MDRFFRILDAVLRLPLLDRERSAPAAVVEHRMALEDEVSKAAGQPRLRRFPDAPADRSPVSGI